MPVDEPFQKVLLHSLHYLGWCNSCIIANACPSDIRRYISKRDLLSKVVDFLETLLVIPPLCMLKYITRLLNK